MAHDQTKGVEKVFSWKNLSRQVSTEIIIDVTMESNKKNVYIFIFLGVKKVLLFNAQEIEIRESLNAAYSFRESTKRKKITS